MSVINKRVLDEALLFEHPKWKLFRGRWWHWERSCWAAAFVQHLADQGLIEYKEV